jgi:hypothetical protein
MEWPDLLECRPIEKWPGELTPEWLRKRSPFDAPLSTTVQQLSRELDHLNAIRPMLQVALRPRDIRLDGKPRSDARPDHPGVILSYIRRGRSKRFHSVDHARTFLAEMAELSKVLSDDKLYKAAAMKAHPDHESGSHDKWLKVQEAWKLINAQDTFQFAVDVFPTWQANLRAITLGLEALRRVQRYGIVKEDEQYTGFKALTSGRTT